MSEVFEMGNMSDLSSAETAEMTVWLNGKETNWKWTWAGPGHPKTVTQRRRMDKERLSLEALQEQARVNNRKYKAPEIDPEQDFANRVTQLVERLVGWSDVTVGGQVLAFSEDKAREILSNPSNVQLYLQSWEFLGADTSFIKRSAINSEVTLSVVSG